MPHRKSETQACTQTRIIFEEGAEEIEPDGGRKTCGKLEVLQGALFS